MLYRYFIGTGETNIESVEQVYKLHKKGMINSTSKLYEVESNVYVTASEIPEFNDVFRGDYTKEEKSTKMFRYMVSFMFFLMFLLISMVNAFLNLGIEKMENDTTYFFSYLIATFLGVSGLIAFITLIGTKVSKKYSSMFIVSSSVILFIISIFFLIW